MSTLGAFPGSSPLGQFIESPLGARTGACLAMIEIVAAGINAAICNSCLPFLNGSHRNTALSVDGTYNTPIDENVLVACVYRELVENSYTSVIYGSFGDTTCVTPTQTTTTDLSIMVQLTSNRSQILGAWIGQVGNEQNPATQAFDSGTGPFDFGAAIANTLTCSGSSLSPYSDGGTITINRL